ncbi:protealysin inhibitor emfourin [Aldersonia kunmingensis]|uniref:protealysin inhibitor emfourin n=1 Tax=Aldersonia kunmingensis TaxID=408066 RepID=UPI0008313254|nr:protealysin inhibitor emfourin [Aldersonia kunmingensis]
MRVAVSRTGGVAGITRTWSVQLDDQPEVADEVCRLVDACPWAEASRAGLEAGADRFVYRVDAGELTATVGEPQVKGPWRSLIDRVIDLDGGM